MNIELDQNQTEEILLKSLKQKLIQKIFNNIHYTEIMYFENENRDYSKMKKIILNELNELVEIIEGIK